jgi:hypothetical protein
MSKKSKRMGRDASAPETPAPGNSRSRRRRYYAAVLSAFAVLAVSATATRYDPVRRAVGLRPLAIAQATPTPLPLAKEYVYAGGRLVATEEPMPAATPRPTPAGPPPTNLIATASSASSVSLTWTAPGAGVLSYVVERKDASGTQEISTGSASASFNDSTTPGDYAYLYRVKAVYAGGTSLYSNQDLATTVVFTDNSLQGVTIMATHLIELRRAVAAVRALVPTLGVATWTYPNPVSSPASQRRTVYLEDVTDLRVRLDEALTPLNLWSPYPAEPPLTRGGKVYADHFEQIRSRVR